MKKITLLLSAALFSIASFAQDQDESVVYGVNLGANFSNFTSETNAFKSGSGTNFQVGISMELPIDENFGFFYHVNYDRKSYSTEYSMFNYETNEDVNVKSRETINYLSVPLGFRYYIGDNKNFFVNAGGYIDFLLGGKSETEGHGSMSYGMSDDSPYKTFAFGVYPGAGYRLPLSESHELLFEARYNIGLSDVNEYVSGTRINGFLLSVSFRVSDLDL